MPIKWDNKVNPKVIQTTTEADPQEMYESGYGDNFEMFNEHFPKYAEMHPELEESNDDFDDLYAYYGALMGDYSQRGGKRSPIALKDRKELDQFFKGTMLDGLYKSYINYMNEPQLLKKYTGYEKIRNHYDLDGAYSVALKNILNGNRMGLSQEEANKLAEELKNEYEALKKTFPKHRISNYNPYTAVGSRKEWYKRKK